MPCDTRGLQKINNQTPSARGGDPCIASKNDIELTAISERINHKMKVQKTVGPTYSLLEMSEKWLDHYTSLFERRPAQPHARTCCVGT